MDGGSTASSLWSASGDQRRRKGISPQKLTWLGDESTLRNRIPFLAVWVTRGISLLVITTAVLSAAYVAFPSSSTSIAANQDSQHVSANVRTAVQIPSDGQSTGSANHADDNRESSSSDLGNETESLTGQSHHGSGESQPSDFTPDDVPPVEEIGVEDPYVGVWGPDKYVFQKAREAIFAERKSEPPAVAKLAFLFLIRDKLPFANLWARFFRGHEGKFSIYIHANPLNYTLNETQPHVPPVFRKRFIFAMRVKWGRPLLVKAERRALANALIDPANQWFILISDTCIPLYDFNYVYDYITKSPRSFISQIKETNKLTWTPNLLPQVPKSMWRKGDQWKALMRKHAILMVNDTEYYDRFVIHYGCPKCFFPKVRGLMDEHYFPSVLYKLAAEEIENRTVTWVDWANPNERSVNNTGVKTFHPHRYHREEVNMDLIAEIKSKTVYKAFNDAKSPDVPCKVDGVERPCFLFARKFDSKALPLVMNMSQHAFGFT